MAQKTSTHVRGSLRICFAETTDANPVQSKLQLILTDFQPNGNKQAIPYTEAENIIKTAQHQPLKIAFDGADIGGHLGALPIGVITRAYAAKDGDRDVIQADGILWDTVHPDAIELLKQSDRVGTSWEIYYADAALDDAGNEWLQECVFGSQCIVKVPAYGPERTRILAIAEKLTQTNESHSKELKTANPTQYTQTTPSVQHSGSQVPSRASMQEDNMDETVKQALELLRGLVVIETQHENPHDELLALAQASVDVLQNQRAALDQYAAAEEQRAYAAKRETRANALGALGINIANRESFYMGLDDATFTELTSDISAARTPTEPAPVEQPVAQPAAVASLRLPAAPEPQPEAQEPLGPALLRYLNQSKRG